MNTYEENFISLVDEKSKEEDLEYLKKLHSELSRQSFQFGHEMVIYQEEYVKRKIEDIEHKA